MCIFLFLFLFFMKYPHLYIFPPTTPLSLVHFLVTECLLRAPCLGASTPRVCNSDFLLPRREEKERGTALSFYAWTA